MDGAPDASTLAVKRSRDCYRTCPPFPRRGALVGVVPGEDHRRRRALEGAVVDGLDVVAVGIEHERGVVAGVVRPLRQERRCRGHRRRAQRRRSAARCPRPQPGTRDAKPFVGVPSLLTYSSSAAKGLGPPRTGFRAARRSLVEAPAGVEVGDAQVNVIQEPSPRAPHPWSAKPTRIPRTSDGRGEPTAEWCARGRSPCGERHLGMTAAELKRKLRNSPFAPLSWRIQFGNA